MNGINSYQMFSNGMGQDLFMKSLTKNNATKGTDTKAKEPVKSAKMGSTSTVAQGIELSDAAKSMLEKLKEKYDNVDFFVADYSTDEEAQKYLSQGSKGYSVLMDPELLEKMASDEEEAAKYDELIASSIGQLDDIKEQLGEEGADVKSLGITIDADGSTKFFAELEKSGERQKEMIEKAREERKEKAKEEEKSKEKKDAKEALAQKAAKEAEAFNPVKKTTVSASSIEELIEKIKGVDWSSVEAKARPTTGAFIDFSA